MKTVKEIMTTHVPAIYADSELTEAIDELHQHTLFCAPVLDGQQHLVGFISEQQMLAPLLQSSYFCEGKIMVKELMTDNVVSVTEHMNIVDLAQQMQGNKPKVYPVTSNGKVIGLVTRSQVIEALKQDYLSCSVH
ncbi:CBS domain-containing protein [Pseudoalteromonas sp. MMG012]|uniref:CBS domain-containing protein n=1 Tax=Pseudoalteromonas sp. MMG012 TaxID=2822686 RepID=UPI001B3A048A|nr:CBS domain-containing protein [Pseudoalteromonas sp. MMG012]MBQ4850021.1 CBS domain-containing protein [Pseudoalteromonas sp. MMG012]